MGRSIALRTAVFTLVVPGTVAGVVPALLVRGAPSLPPAEGWPFARLVLGLPLVLAGLLLYAWCVWAFGRLGRGTPAPIDPPRVLVSRGPYAWSRNPMYVGVLAVILGQAALFASPRLLAYAAAVFLGFHLFTVLYEEPAHRRRFGAAFDEYCRRVPRWIPRGG